MKSLALMLCLTPAVVLAADVPADSPTKSGLQQAASGSVSLDKTYENQAAVAQASAVDGTLGARKIAPVNLAMSSPLSVKDAGAPPSPASVNAARKGVAKADSEGAAVGFMSGFIPVFYVPEVTLCMIPFVGWIAAAVLAAPLFLAGCIAGGIGAAIGSFF